MTDGDSNRRAVYPPLPGSHALALLAKMADTDGDGVRDDEDACPNSNLATTVVIVGCGSSVTNHLLENGCTIRDEILALADLIAAVAENTDNNGELVSGVSHLSNQWVADDLITGAEKGAIVSCTGNDRGLPNFNGPPR